MLLLALGVRQWNAGRQPPPPPEVLLGEEFALKRVVDGDTLVLENEAKARLIGVDTPEVFERGGSGKRMETPEPWGSEASAFTKEFTASGMLRLQFDKERKDRYGRFLAYVWVGDKMLNEELVRAGLARFAPRYRYSAAMKKRFGKAQDEAKAARRGIWSE